MILVEWNSVRIMLIVSIIDGELLEREMYVTKKEKVRTLKKN